MKSRILITLFLCFSGLGYAQVLIQGTVVSAEDNTALPGAVLLLKASMKLSRSDKSGHFSMSASAVDTLLSVSFTGYAPQEILIRDRGSSSLRIVLHALNNQLKEVTVSSGYQQLPRERATGSFSFIDQKTLNEQVSTDILSRLEAVSNALYVNRSTSGSSSIMVRGLSTIRGNKNALIVLDNFPYEGDLNSINPNDVDNITILKDAAAASIWGSQAANGVIVITTKKGRYNSPVSVNFTATATLGQKPDLSYFTPVSTAGFIAMEEFAYGKGYYNSRISSTARSPLSPVVELLIKKTAGSLTEEQYRQQVAPFSDLDVRDQYEQYLYSNSLNQQYALSLQGGSGKHSWLAAAGYDRNADNLDARYKRMNLRFQNSFQPFKQLRLNAAITYTLTGNQAGRPGYGGIKVAGSELYPYARLADDAGNALNIAQLREEYIQTAGGGKLLRWDYKPLEELDHYSNTSTSSDMLLNTGLNYALFKGLAFDVKYQHERQQGRGRVLNDQDSYFARDLVNRFTQLDAATGNLTYNIPKGGILDLSEKLLTVNNLRGSLNYQRKWTMHELNLLLGSELRDAKNSSNSHRIFGYSDDILTFTDVDLTRQFPSFINGSLNYVPGKEELSQTSKRFVSAFANGAYTYLGRYTLSASGRRDASNLFGLNTNDKWNVLWSAGASWDISKEPFYSISALSYLRLRATYGFSGSIDPAMSAVTTIIYRGTSVYTTGVPYAGFSNYANPDLKWETTRMFNAGLDFGTAGNRISGSLECYLKRSYNLFGFQEMDVTAGVGQSIVKNAASMKGTGADINLNTLNVKTGHFRWSSQLNFSYNTDEVMEYYLPTATSATFTNTGAITAANGKPVYSVYSFGWAGLDPQTGQPRAYLNGEVSTNYSALMNGKVNFNDLDYGGRLLPPYFGTLGNTLNYKQLSLSVQLSYKLGHFFRRQSISYNSLFNLNQGHADFDQRWQQAGDEQHTDVPAMLYPLNANRDFVYLRSAPLVENASHIRLQYINLSYSPNLRRFSTGNFSNIHFFVNADNLGIIWRKNKLGIDPDYAQYGQNPPSGRWSIGVKASMK